MGGLLLYNATGYLFYRDAARHVATKAGSILREMEVVD